MSRNVANWYSWIWIWIGIGLGGWLAGAVVEAAAPSRAEQIRFFEESVRPVLAKHCFKCHGEEKQRGNLRLDSLARMQAGGESGPAIVAGKPEESLLVEAINFQSLEMPPDGKLPDSEIAVLTQWIKLGAPWPEENAPVAAARKAKQITDADRAFWSFQPPRDFVPPEVADAGWSRNAIDRFVFQRLASERLAPSAEADRPALARRLYFDLLGLPPTADEVAAFVADPSPDAYEVLVDRLLGSPRHAERWSRHWLDLVRYAESDGFKQDAYRPQAWRYRDYVIRSLNADKPYDQFIREQLAGDEIAPHDPEALVATGFLRHWIYEYNQRDVRTQWTNILNDVTDVTADVFLGLGLGCARCHDHKFDPLLQRDYFRLQAFFTPLAPRDVTLPGGDANYESHLAEWERATADIRRELAELERPHRERAANGSIEKFPKDIRPMMRKPAGERSPFEHQLAELAYRQVELEFETLNMPSKLKGEAKDRYESLKKQLAEFDAQKPKPPLVAMAVSDVGAVPPATSIPGDRSQQEIAPGFPTLFDPEEAVIVPPNSASSSTGRRTALAAWLTRPDHPLTTRVIVNRVWQQHFGRGLVSTASDFGHLGEPPSHPELLDWLARDFVEHEWSFKHLHRRMVTSAAYRQSAVRPAVADARLKDPQNRLLWRKNVRRLDAEQIRDAMLAVSGELEHVAGGPSQNTDRPCRSAYLKVLRNSQDALLDAFDAADGFASTSLRNVTTTPTQSLLMINGSWTLARAKAWAAALERRHFASPSDLADAAYRAAFGRPPTTEETAAAVTFLSPRADAAQPAAALVDFCHALLNSNEFLYVD